MITVEQWIEKQQKRLELLQRSDGPLYIAASTVLKEQVDRIFKHGKASDGSEIGQYNSTDPLYVNPKYAPQKFTPKGKHGDTKFADGRPHKTGYFESYRAFRSSQGRPVDGVNLHLRGRLEMEYRNSLTKQDDNTWRAEITSKEGRKKAIGNQYRFRKAIFSLTDEERELFTEKIKQEFKAIYDA